VIGLSTCVVGARLFRWDAGQRVPASNKAWVGAALVVWAGVGLAAEMTKRQVVAPDVTASIVGRASNPVNRSSPYGPVTPATQSATAPVDETPSTTLPAGPTTAQATTPPGPPVITQTPPWEQVTRAQAESIKYDDVPDDDGTEVPLAHNLDDLEKEGRERLEGIADKLAAWEPGKDKDLGQKVRGLLSVAAVADVLQDPQEGQIPFVIFEKLKADEKNKDRLIRAVTWVILNPDEGTVETNIKEFTDTDIGVAEELVRIRTTLYGKKLLFRLLGKEQVQK
jgi:hypothetical protein